MSLELTIRNRQRARALHGRLLRQIIEAVVTKHLQLTQVELGVTLVGSERGWPRYEEVAAAVAAALAAA